MWSNGKSTITTDQIFTYREQVTREVQFVHDFILSTPHLIQYGQAASSLTKFNSLGGTTGITFS